MHREDEFSGYTDHLNPTVKSVTMNAGDNYATVTLWMPDGTEQVHQMTGSSADWAWRTLTVNQTVTVG